MVEETNNNEVLIVKIENLSFTKVGNSLAIIIPSDFFKHSRLNPDKKYNVKFMEAKE